MKTYYLTFYENSPFRDGWVEVEAEDYNTAAQYVMEIFGTKWKYLYAQKSFVKRYYPAGKLGVTIK
jgi:hypothetical protein